MAQHSRRPARVLRGRRAGDRCRRSDVGGRSTRRSAARQGRRAEALLGREEKGPTREALLSMEEA
jgi:hypothetical protein